MSRSPHARTRRRTFATMALALAASAAMTATASATSTPASGSATVDGDIAEWDGAPLFSDMFRAAKPDKVVESKLYLRYQCSTQTLYALVVAEPGVTIDASLPGDSFIKVGGPSPDVDGNSGNDGIAPDFAWVGLSGATATGWEASAIVAPGSYSINVHTQVNDGGSQTSAVPLRAIPLVLECGETPQPAPLEVVKTATTSYQRTYPWTIAKSAAPASPVTTTEDTATFTYTVTATKGEPNDSDNVVEGTITVTNPNETDAEGVTITDQIDGGPACVVTGGADITIPAAVSSSSSSVVAPSNSVTVPYTCNVASSDPGVNVATATWRDVGASSGEAPFSFGAPSKVHDNSVDVVDGFNGAVPTLLLGGDDINQTTTFTYTQTVPVPTTGCTTFPNVARVMSNGKVAEILAEASAQVEACRTAPPATPDPPVTPQTPAVTPTVVVTAGTPSAAKLRIIKRGPARAKAGQVVTFRITVRNTNATTAATSVILTDVLPSGYAFAKRPAGAVLRKGKLVWTFGDLAPGASKTIRVQVRIDRNAGGRRCNTAVASAANAATVRARACTQVVKIAGATRIPIVTG